jgi:hypothetical protein
VEGAKERLCVGSSDIFNLPLAALWTAVLGDWDRGTEEKTEMRVPVDEIRVHKEFNDYQNDIGNFIYLKHHS